jgi:hypothetical protein
MKLPSEKQALYRCGYMHFVTDTTAVPTLLGEA